MHCMVLDCMLNYLVYCVVLCVGFYVSLYNVLYCFVSATLV